MNLLVDLSRGALAFKLPRTTLDAEKHALALGLSRQEQWVLIGTVAVILAGIGLHQWRLADRPGLVVVPGQGRWEKLAEFQASDPARLPAGDTPGEASHSAGREGAVMPPEPARSAPPPAEPSEPLRGVAVSAGIDINAASAEELDRLPGIGPAKARAIVSMRARRGGFQRIDDLLDVSGIGPSTLEKLRPFVSLGATTTTAVPWPPKTPLAPGAAMALSAAPLSARPGAPRAAGVRIDLNTAGERELETLPGVGPVLARRIVEDRVRRGPYRAPEDLARVEGIGPKKLESLRPHLR